MKIGIYNPYFDSLSGGERYVLTLASHWSKHHTVNIFWNDSSVLPNAQKRFSIDLSKVHIVRNVFHDGSLLEKYFISKTYDCIIFLSDGSIPLSFATHNVLHFQVPFTHISAPFWKMSRIDRIVCNSMFTEHNLDQMVKTKRTVIYPPVDVNMSKSTIKKKTILSVGRFSAAYGAKKQDVLIRAFRIFNKNPKFKDWTLVLAGGLLASDEVYYQELRKSAEELPVTFYPNCELHTLNGLYDEASIYWHAAGFGETKPEHMEHFGITTVEAMAAGCIPIVFAGGGQPEIITDNETGLLWKTIAELIQKTANIIGNTNQSKKIQQSAQIRAHDFSIKRFTDSFDSLLTEICKK